MSFYVANGVGDSIDSPSPKQMYEFLNALDLVDEEHGAAWLATEHDDSLEWNGDGRLVFSRGDAPVRHLTNVSRERTLALWQALAAGRIAEVEREAWQPGTGHVVTPERRAQLVAGQRTEDRAFYDLLGPERPGTICKGIGCRRGTIDQSLLCRVHHFEMVTRRPCPFDE